MKKAILLILFVILQTNLFARNCYTRSQWLNYNGSMNPVRCETPRHNCGSGVQISIGCTQECVDRGYGHPECYGNVTCCTDQCAADSLSCPANRWNSQTCSCNPPPCEVFERCETYWNTGNGMGVAIGQGIAAQTDPNYTGQGYYAMRLYIVDTCNYSCPVEGCVTLVMDVPGTCAEHGYCDEGDNSCDRPKSSSSAGSSSSSYEPPECVCMGCFGGSCLVTCSDGSTRTCVGDFDNCSELKNSPEWTQCTAPSSSASGGSSSGGGGSSTSPSSQDNTIDGLNALIDTLHHSNQLQEVGHGIMKAGQAENKSFFEDARGYFAGMLKQITGIFNNTNNISNNTNNINKNLNNISGKLDNIANRPRDTTIVNVGGDTIIVQGDTTIVNFPIDSTIGEPWDTSGGLIADMKAVFDSAIAGNDTLPNWDTIHRGSVDSIGGSMVTTFDSGAGKFYKDTLNGWINNGLQNSVLSGTGSNNCPAFLMSSYPMTIGNITFDLTQNVKLGQYLCQPVIGGRSGWEIGRTILRIIVSIGCMFFLFKCATGTINEE